MTNRIILIIANFVFGINIAVSQMITTNPQYPVASQAVTIRFDATDTPLAGNTGDLYAHTGVNLSNGSNWQHVIGNWGVNTSQPKFTRISTNIYELSVTPSINAFYGVSETETVRQICLVIRNSGSTAQTSPDIFIDVFQPSNSITIVKPDSTQIFSLGESVELSAVALFADSMALYVNDVFVSGVKANNISHSYTVSQSGRNSVKFKAGSSTTTIESTTSFFVRNPNNIADLPFANLKDGINYIDNSTVTLVLYAPGKQFAFLKTEINDWQTASEYQMNQTPDEKRYWITLSGLTPGQEYGFQYNIDGNITVPDAYTDKVLDPWNDKYISSSVYPNLKTYPEGKTSGIVSVFQTAQTPYVWQSTSFTRPEKKDLVIYETHIRDFSDDKTYQLMIDTIGYFKRLGINALELMPVNEFEGNSSWGYNPDFYFAPDKAYGPKNKLKELIDTYHANGIAVIIDIVLNHSYGLSPLVQMYFDSESGNPTADNPWYNIVSPNPSYYWGSDFNHESPDTKRFVSRVLKYWLTEYRVDGFRFDFTKGFTNTPGDGYAFDLARINILKAYADTMWTYAPGSYCILEHLTENSEESVLANYGMMLWGNLNHAYAQAAKGRNAEDDFSWISHKSRGWNQPHVVGYMESHDEERMMYRNLKEGYSAGDYDIRDTITALSRVELAAAFFLGVPGPKMLWQFEELGYDTTINYPDRIGEKPVLWHYAKVPERNKLFYVFREFIKLKKTQDFLKTNDFSLYTTGRIKQIVLRTDETDAVIIGNFDIVEQSGIPAYTNTNTWYDYFTGKIITKTDSAFTLKPGEYHLLTDKFIGTPEVPFAPEASSLSISGEKHVGDTISASYIYFDSNGDSEGESVIKWFSASTRTGSGLKEITKSNSRNFILSYNELNKYIRFEITPVENSTLKMEGKTVVSDWFGLIQEQTGDITLGPVPCRESLNFNNTSAYTKMTIFDSHGKPVAEYDVNHQTSLSIELPDLEAGVYFAKFEGEKSKLIKFVKQ